MSEHPGYFQTFYHYELSGCKHPCPRRWMDIYMLVILLVKLTPSTGMLCYPIAVHAVI